MPVRPACGQEEWTRTRLGCDCVGREGLPRGCYRSGGGTRTCCRRRVASWGGDKALVAEVFRVGEGADGLIDLHADGRFGDVAPLGGVPLVVLLDQHAPGEPEERGRVGEHSHDVGAAFDLLVDAIAGRWIRSAASGVEGSQRTRDAAGILPRSGLTAILGSTDVTAWSRGAARSR